MSRIVTRGSSPETPEAGGATTSVCWICGDEGETREHRAKASDLRAILPSPKRENPIFLHTATRRNIKVGSLKAKALKFKHRICLNCNSARTQPHDRAWETFSDALRSRTPPVAIGQFVRCNGVFRSDTSKWMLRLHLYFVKLFGCQIAEENIQIDIKPFSRAILEERPHPHLYLAFGPNPGWSVSGSDMHVEHLNGKPAYAVFFYGVGALCVSVMYALPGEKRDGLAHAWHPRIGCQRLTMTQFVSDESAVL